MPISPPQPSTQPTADLNQPQQLQQLPQTTQHGFITSPLPATPLRPPILRLPPELLLQSLSHLDPRDIAISERVCKDWFDTCRDDACWRMAFFARFDAATAPGRRLTPVASSFKAEYLLRAKMLRLWSKSAAKSRVADLKVSHLTNLELLPQGGALVASTWSGRAQIISPATLKPTRLSLLPDSNIADEVVSCSLNTDYIYWCTHTQLCAIDLDFKGSTRVLDAGMGSISALSTVDGQSHLVLVAFLNGFIALYDAEQCSKIWESTRLADQDDVPLTVKALAANSECILAATSDILFLMPLTQTPTAESAWQLVLAGQLSFIALDQTDALVHEADRSLLTRYHQGQPIRRFVGSDSPISAITHDFSFAPSDSAQFGQRKFVAAGRQDGSVDIWLWDPPSLNQDVQPARTLQPDFKGEEMRVTALCTSDLLLFAGHLDGCIRAYDMLAGTLVRVFNEGSTPRHALRQLRLGQIDERRWMVSAVAANDRVVYATLGERLWTWTCTETFIAKKKKRKGPKLSHRAERYREEADLEDELLEYEEESATPAVPARRQPFGLESLLSDEEALQYAQLLSVEAEEERQLRRAEVSAEMDFDLEELLAADASDMRSPIISEHDYEDVEELPSQWRLGSSATSPIALSAARSPTLSPHLAPRSGRSFSHLSDAILSTSLEDQSHFPTLASSPARPEPSFSPSPPPSTTRSAWSAVARGSTPASATSTPSRASSVAPSIALDEDEDEELKLAIQLSLLETRG